MQGVHVVAEGRPAQLTCLAPAGLPPPVLRWLDPAGADVTDRSQVSSVCGEVGARVLREKAGFREFNTYLQ